MNGIQVRINQTDSNCLNVLLLQGANDLACFFDKQWTLDRAVSKNTLAQFEPQSAWHQRTAAGPVGVLQIGPPLSSHLQVVTKTASRNVARRCGRAFNNGIGGNSGAVNKILDPPRSTRLAHTSNNIFTNSV